MLPRHAFSLLTLLLLLPRSACNSKSHERNGGSSSARAWEGVLLTCQVAFVAAASAGAAKALLVLLTALR